MGQRRLALLGGEPTISAETALPAYPSIGKLERVAIDRVTSSGQLSGFYGSWGSEFFGGTEVQALEREWAQRFHVDHAISLNSATSGLIAAVGACGISPGDEVIVPPLTMSATVVAPLFYGGIPVFADVDERTFCLDPRAVEAAITPHTKAIITVNLFGHPSPLAQLREIADRHNLHLIEDNAQSPLAEEAGELAGTVGDIGIFSLNYHKHIHAGEGGICVTNNEQLSQRLSMIRNHGENVVDSLGISSPVNLVGQNYRLTELSAAVARAQLEKAEAHVQPRIDLAQALSDAVVDVPGIQAPFVREDCKHVYYVWAMRFDAREFGCSRELFSKALTSEGFPHGVGYVKPLYRLPVFSQLVAFGRPDESGRGFPFTLTNRDYQGELCPVAERLQSSELIIFEPCQFSCDAQLIERLSDALHKVSHAPDQLASAQKQLGNEVFGHVA